MDREEQDMAKAQALAAAFAPASGRVGVVGSKHAKQDH